MNVCDQSLLAGLLHRELSRADEQDLICHLDTCESCQRALESRTADQQTWDDSSLLLEEQPFDSESASIDWPADDSDPSPVAPSIRYVLDALSPTDDPHMLGRLGHYEVSGVIGAGGMGVVLKAFDKPLDRIVAMKVLAPHLACSAAARKRFAREAKAVAAVLHPNVIAIHGVSDGDQTLPYLVMPYIRGSSLQARIDEQGPLSVVEVLRVASQIADGLAAAHAQGLVHRDIKPANILLEDGVERVSITDFGLARTVDDATLTHSGVIAGTPLYMSPEQASGNAIDARSDLFSLGSVIYTMCTARPPFRADSAMAVLRRITDDTARPIAQINPEIPIWMDRLVRKLHAKNPDERYDSASRVGDVLQHCLTHLNSPGEELPDELREPRRTDRKVVLIAALALAMVIGLVKLSQVTESPNTNHQQVPPIEIVDRPLIPWNDSARPDLDDVQLSIDELDRRTQLPF
jgi:serine/threonine protein kinase